MQTRQPPHSHCDACGEPIHYGKPAVSFCRVTEQRDLAGASNYDQITILDSLDLLTLCPACGEGFSVTDAEKILRDELKRRQVHRN